MYYDTTNLDSKQVEAFKLSNHKQDDMVLKIIKALNRPFSPKDVFNNYPVASVPLTSIRRSINTLCAKLLLIEKTGEQVPGLYGRPETQYKLKGANNG